MLDKFLLRIVRVFLFEKFHVAKNLLAVLVVGLFQLFHLELTSFERVAFALLEQPRIVPPPLPVQKLVGGLCPLSALGGGTLVGLASRLCDCSDFEELCRMAERGERRRADLVLADIYPGEDSPLPGDVTAASLEKLGRRPADDGEAPGRETNHWRSQAS